MRMHGLLFVLAFFAGCTAMPPKSDYLTPSQLIAARDEYNGKRVKVRGWMRAEFENYSLWESKKASERGTYIRDCVSLLIPESMPTTQYDKHYVEIDAVFLEKLPSNVIHLGGCNVPTLQLIEGVPPLRVNNNSGQ